MTDTTMRADATPVAAAGKLAICIVIAAIVFAAHTVAIINHFEFGGFLLDSGWFAYLFGTVDPLLINPSAINGNSFYSIHFSPVIYLWFDRLAGWFRFRSSSPSSLLEEP